MSLIKKDKSKTYIIEFTASELEVILKLLKLKKYLENETIENNIRKVMNDGKR